MERYIRQARHNLQLHNRLCNDYPEDFHDWKVTLLFYSALHWIRALAAQKSIDIGHSHFEIERSCNPLKGGSMPISRKAWDEYDFLNKRSRTARYDGIRDMLAFKELHFMNHRKSLPGLEYLRKYLQGRGLVP